MKDTDTSRLCICHPPSRIGGANSAMKGAIVCLTNWSKIIRVAHMQSGSRIRRDQIADALVNMACLQCLVATRGAASWTFSQKTALTSR